MSYNRSCPHHFHCNCDPLFAAAHKGKCAAHQGCNCVAVARRKAARQQQETPRTEPEWQLISLLILLGFTID